MNYFFPNCEKMDIFKETSQLLWIFAATLVFIWLIRKILRRQTYPPGPYGLPLLGYLPFIRKKAYETFSDLEQKYGKIISVPIGLFQSLIVINDGNISKQVLSHAAALARPKELFQLLPEGGGFISSSGKEWLDQRRICVLAMKNLGLGRDKWETMIHDEAIEFIKEIKTLNGKAVDYTSFLEFYQTSNMLSLLIGKKVITDKHSLKAQIFMKTSDTNIQFMTATSVASNAPPFVSKLLAKFKIAGYDALFKNLNNFEQAMREEVRNHFKSKQLNQEPNFIDHYFEEHKKENGNLSQELMEKEIIGNLSVLFLAAIDTTRSSLNWLLLLTALFPDVQKKIHQEIDDVIGSDRLIYWDERNILPYTMATIFEMLRYVATVPLLVQRRTTADIKADKYIIPKGSIVVVNNWRISRGSENYDNPDDFKPERFLKTNGNEKKPEYFMPFSTGKRNCPGEHIAMMTLFLFYTTIMQNFRLATPERKSISLEDTGSILVRHAITQELCFIEK